MDSRGLSSFTAATGRALRSRGWTGTAIVRAMLVAGFSLLTILNAGCEAVEKQAEKQMEKPKETTGVVCNRFEVSAELEGSDLVVSLATDLPVDTNIVVSATRDYNEKGQATTYSIDYLFDKSRVSQWSQPRRFDVSNAKAMREFEKKREKQAAVGIAGKIGTISKKLEVRVLVPMNQDNPDFGKGNVHLSGSCPIETSGSGKVVEWKTEFDYPLTARPKEPRRADPSNLAKGKTFRISKDTPLMPHHSPKDPYAALQRKKNIPAKGTIAVRSIFLKKGSPWYEVTAKNAQGKTLGRGWINSTALIGQRIERVR